MHPKSFWLMELEGVAEAIVVKNAFYISFKCWSNEKNKSVRKGTSSFKYGLIARLIESIFVFMEHS